MNDMGYKLDKLQVVWDFLNILRDMFISILGSDCFPKHPLWHFETSPRMRGQSVELAQDITVTSQGLSNINTQWRLHPGSLQSPLDLPGEDCVDLRGGHVCPTVTHPDTSLQLHHSPAGWTEDYAHFFRHFLSDGKVLLASRALTVKPIIILKIC